MKKILCISLLSLSIFSLQMNNIYAAKYTTVNKKKYITIDAKDKNKTINLKNGSYNKITIKPSTIKAKIDVSSIKTSNIDIFDGTYTIYGNKSTKISNINIDGISNITIKNWYQSKSTVNIEPFSNSTINIYSSKPLTINPKNNSDTILNIKSGKPNIYIKGNSKNANITINSTSTLPKINIESPSNININCKTNNLEIKNTANGENITINSTIDYVLNDSKSNLNVSSSGNIKIIKNTNFDFNNTNNQSNNINNNNNSNNNSNNNNTSNNNSNNNTVNNNNTINNNNTSNNLNNYYTDQSAIYFRNGSYFNDYFYVNDVDSKLLDDFYYLKMPNGKSVTDNNVYTAIRNQLEQEIKLRTYKYLGPLSNCEITEFRMYDINDKKTGAFLDFNAKLQDYHANFYYIGRTIVVGTEYDQIPKNVPIVSPTEVRTDLDAFVKAYVKTDVMYYNIPQTEIKNRLKEDLIVTLRERYNYSNFYNLDVQVEENTLEPSLYTVTITVTRNNAYAQKIIAIKALSNVK